MCHISKQRQNSILSNNPFLTHKRDAMIGELKERVKQSINSQFTKTPKNFDIILQEILAFSKKNCEGTIQLNNLTENQSNIFNKQIGLNGFAIEPTNIIKSLLSQFQVVLEKMIMDINNLSKLELLFITYLSLQSNDINDIVYIISQQSTLNKNDENQNNDLEEKISSEDSQSSTVSLEKKLQQLQNQISSKDIELNFQKNSEEFIKSQDSISMSSISSSLNQISNNELLIGGSEKNAILKKHHPLQRKRSNSVQSHSEQDSLEEQEDVYPLLNNNGDSLKRMPQLVKILAPKLRRQSMRDDFLKTKKKSSFYRSLHQDDEVEELNVITCPKNQKISEMNTDFIGVKQNPWVQKIMKKKQSSSQEESQGESSNFFSDQIIKVSHSRENQKRMICLDSANFYVINYAEISSLDFKKFPIHEISKIIISSKNNSLCSIHIKNEFQLMIESSRREQLVSYIVNIFESVIKKQSPPILRSESQEKIMIKSQEESQEDSKHLFKVLLQMNNNNQSKNQSLNQLFTASLQIQNNNIQIIDCEINSAEKNKPFSVFSIDKNLVNGQQVFQFVDKNKNQYFLKLQENLDSPFFIQNLKMVEKKQ